MFNTENQGVNTYLTYKIGEGDIIDSLSLGMLTNNRIPGVADVLFTQMNEDKYLKYNISSKVSAKQFFDGVVTKKRFLSILSGVANAIISAEEYMVDPSSFILDLDYIYTDVSSENTLLICLPIENSPFKAEDIQGFFRHIVFSTQYDQNENCDYVTKVINYLNSVTSFSISDFKRFVDSINLSSGERHTAAGYGGGYKEPTATPTPAREMVKNTVLHRPAVPAQSKADASKIVQQEKKAEPVSSLPFKMPGSKANAPTPEKSEKKEPTGEKVSLVYLLRHYNKENLELYKAQHQKPENAKEASKKPSKKKVPQKTGKGGMSSFAIPGQQVSMPSVAENESVSKSSSANEARSQAPLAKSFAPKVENSQPYSSDAGETTLLGASGETTVLGEVGGVQLLSRRTAYLIREKTGEQVMINKPRFRIGKERSCVDFFIGDNTAISRGHADIVIRDDRYYIIDMNSTNHTFVNGMMLQSGEEFEIQSGAKVRLANEEFDFEIR